MASISLPPTSSLPLTTPPASPSAATRIDNGLITLRYEDSQPAKPPIAVTVAPPRAPPTDTHPALRRPKSSASESTKEEEHKRDSGLAPTTSSKAREGSVNTVEAIDEDPMEVVKIDFDANSLVTTPLHSPAIAQGPVKVQKSDSMGSNSRWKPGLRKSSNPRTPTGEMLAEETAVPALKTEISTDAFLDEEDLRNMSFSKRGSVMLGGKKVNGQARQNGGRAGQACSMVATPSIRVLSEDVEMESQKVRSLYEQGTNLNWEEASQSGIAERLNEPAEESGIAK